MAAFVSMWRGTLIAILVCGVASGTEKFTVITLTPESVGVIVGTNGAFAGSAFVTGTPSRIITCEHVAAVQPAFNYTFINATGAHLSVTIETVLRRYDLAVMRLDSTNQLAPLPYGDIRRIRPGDDVVYAGWNSANQGLKISKAVVTAVGVAYNEGV